MKWANIGAMGQSEDGKKPKKKFPDNVPEEYRHFPLKKLKTLSDMGIFDEEEEDTHKGVPQSNER